MCFIIFGFSFIGRRLGFFVSGGVYVCLFGSGIINRFFRISIVYRYKVLGVIFCFIEWNYLVL